MALVHAWNLPAIFLEITSKHHQTQATQTGLLSLIRPSCMLANALGFFVGRDRTGKDYEELLAQFPEGARGCFPADAGELAGCIKKEIRLLESA